MIKASFGFYNLNHLQRLFVKILLIEGHPGPIFWVYDLRKMRKGMLILDFNEIHFGESKILEVLFNRCLASVTGWVKMEKETRRDISLFLTGFQ
jgi:hypothetical protein